MTIEKSKTIGDLGSTEIILKDPALEGSVGSETTSVMTPSALEGSSVGPAGEYGYLRNRAGSVSTSKNKFMHSPLSAMMYEVRRRLSSVEHTRG